MGANFKFRAEVVRLCVMIIQVVVHLISRNGSFISDLQVQAQIQALNRDFRKKGREWRLLPEPIKSIAADVGIEFCLVSVTPSGDKTNGINRIETNIADFALTDDIFFSARGGSDAWPTEKYLNIWVGEMPTGLLGFSSKPSEAGRETDGVVINSKYFGTSNALTPYQHGRTLVHEVGHYLGLVHPWGEVEGDCQEDDNIDDTPIIKGPHYFCPPSEIRACNDAPFHWNFMDYTPDCCMALFTNQQAEMMRYILEHYRKGLIRKECMPQGHIRWHPQVIPNPVEHSALFELGRSDVVKVEIRNLNGQLIKRIKIPEGQSQLELCMNDYIKGLYICTVVARDGSKESCKFIFH